MAGVKGRSGGARPGAGRKPNPPTMLALATSHDDPEKFLRAVMNDAMTDVKVRVDAAKALMPYTHARKGEGGKKGERDEAGKRAAEGRYAPAAPPARTSAH